MFIFRYLIDSLQRSYLNIVPGGKQLDVVSKETTPFNQIFGGYMRQEVTCLRCKHVSTTFQHIMDILVDIRQASTIEEALSHTFRPEKLGQPGDEASMYKCEKCKIKVSARRRCFLERPPAVLCIQLKRFSLFGGKIGKPVQLNRHLNVTNFVHPAVTRRLLAPNDIHYVLRSMITHEGPSPNCGHYTAIGEAAGGQFFQFDDSSVRPIALQQVLRTASYVVFYEMVPSSWKKLVGVRPNIATASPSPKPSVTPKPSPSPSPSLSAAPRMINASGLVNKLGVVSASVAKGMVSSVTDVAKSLNGQKSSKNGLVSKMTGLVPYDKDSSSDEDTPKAKATPVPKPSFVPRAVTIKNLPKPVSATNGKWTVTDIDHHHNPSVHSDNSTGSTSNSWKITPQRPQSAMSSEDISTGKWTVTPLRKAIEDTTDTRVNIDLNGEQKSINGGGTSTPSSSSTSSRSSIDKSRKRPSVDENIDDYDAELDRGRTKKVKKFEAHTGFSSGNSNPFQTHQDRQNNQRHSSNSSGGNRSSHHRNWDDNRFNKDRGHNGHYHQRFHSGYNRDKQQNRHGYQNGRRKSFGGGGGSGQDNRYNSNKSYNRNYESDHYRDFNRRRSR